MYNIFLLIVQILRSKILYFPSFYTYIFSVVVIATASFFSYICTFYYDFWKG